MGARVMSLVETRVVASSATSVAASRTTMRGTYATSSKPYAVLGGRSAEESRERWVVVVLYGGTRALPVVAATRAALFVAASTYVAWTHLYGEEEEGVEASTVEVSRNEARGVWHGCSLPSRWRRSNAGEGGKYENCVQWEAR